MRTLLVVVVVLCAVVCGLGSGCERNGGGVPAGGGATSVVLQLNWKAEPQFGGFYAAQVGGQYKNHGLDVEVREGGAGAPTVDMLAAGTVPFAVVSGDEIVVARARGKPVVALFAVYQTHPQGIMSRASRGFAKIDDVFAQPGTLAMEQGLPYAEFLKRKFGFDKLKVVPSPFGDLAVFRTEPNYSMQCFVTSEPLAAKRAGLDVKTFLIADAGYNPYATVLATSESYVKDHRDAVRSMVTAAREGWLAYLNDARPANEAMAKVNPTMDAATFAESAEAQRPLIETADTSSGGLGAMTAERWSTLVTQMREVGAIDAAVDPAACFVDPRQLER